MQDIARWAFRQEHTVDIEEIKLSRNVVFINKNKKKERKRDKTGGRNNYIDRVWIAYEQWKEAIQVGLLLRSSLVRRAS